MTVCSFFLQGRCRYGEKCWNEHPRGAGGGYGGYNNNRSVPQSSSYRGGGEFGNKVWVNPSQRSSGRDYVSSTSFSRGGSNWGKEADGEPKSSSFSFTTQNRFSGLDSQSFDQPAQDDSDKHLETIHKDMEVWETSGQWLLSCYSVLKVPISGFSDLSPEELRLEYYKSRETGSLHTYVNQMQQLFSQYKSRIQEVRAMNSASLAKLVSASNDPNSQPSSAGFGSLTSGFGKGGFGTGSFDSRNFSFKASSSGFGSADTHVGSTGFGMVKPPQSTSLFGSSADDSTSLSAASFSFAAPTASTGQPGGFGSPSGASGFSFSSTGFGSSFGSAASSSTFGRSGSASVAPVLAGASGGSVSKLFTPNSELSADELEQFKGTRFTLGQVPLKPPPVDMLTV